MNPPPFSPMLRYWIVLAVILTVIFMMEAWFGFDAIPALQTYDPADGLKACRELYLAFRREAHSSSGVAIMAALTGVIASLAFIVIPAQPTSDRRDLLTALRAQPQVPLGTLAAVMFGYTSYRMELQSSARDLAAQVIEVIVAEAPARGREQHHHACTALRVRWEKKLGDSTLALGRELDVRRSGGEPSGQAPLRATLKAQAVASDVQASAARIGSPTGAAMLVDTDDVRRVLDELSSDRDRLMMSVASSQWALEHVDATLVPPTDVEQWMAQLTEVEQTLVDVRASSEKLVESLPVMASEPAPHQVIAPLASKLEEAAVQVESVASEVDHALSEKAAIEAFQ